MKGIEDRRQSQIKDGVESKDIDPHGNNDIKYGALAYGGKRGPEATLGLGERVRSQLAAKGELQCLRSSLFARFEAKPGKEEEVVAFLKQGLQLANQETTTPLWFALRIGPATFVIFDAFRDEAGRQNHPSGPVAKALMAQAPNLLAAPPVIEGLEVLGAELPK